MADRLAIGSLATLYRCDLPTEKGSALGVLKIARDARSNSALQNEARILQLLSASADFATSQAFLPRLIDSFDYDDGSGEPARRANVLAYDAEIHSPEDLFSLRELRAAYPVGLDAKDVAWIWRRLVSILSFCHAGATVHAAVLPEHVLIEPREHKLVLIDWCFAATCAAPAMGACSGQTPSASSFTLRCWLSLFTTTSSKPSDSDRRL